MAVSDGTHTLVASEEIGVGHAEYLAPKVADLLKAYGAMPSDVGRVCATTGPGSFMGTRVGLSYAAGFALPRDVPTYPITTLEALWLSAPEGASGAVLIDARRDQVYGQVFGPDGTAPFLLDLEEAKSRTAPVKEGVLIGSGVPLMWPDAELSGPRTPDLQLVIDRTKTLSVGPLQPLYLRPPDAKPMAARG